MYLKTKKAILLFLIIPGLLILSQNLFAHCDTRNGPVVLAAQEALKTNNVNLVLIWVQKNDENIIKEAFQNTIDLRKISPAVRQTVDNYFFETLVRIHRAGEGVAYTGIKDTAAVEIPIKASEDAIKTNSVSGVLKLLNHMINKGVNEKFKDVISKRNYDVNNVEAGREYVKSYVVFLHYIEAIYNAAGNAGTAHHEHETGSMPEEQPAFESKANLFGGTDVSPTSPIHNYRTHIMIISGVILIILVQIILNRKKTA